MNPCCRAGPDAVTTSAVAMWREANVMRRPSWPPEPLNDLRSTG